MCVDIELGHDKDVKGAIVLGIGLLEREIGLDCATLIGEMCVIYIMLIYIY